jgi:hypothetical protein
MTSPLTVSCVLKESVFPEDEVIYYDIEGYCDRFEFSTISATSPEEAFESLKLMFGPRELRFLGSENEFEFDLVPLS